MGVHYGKILILRSILFRYACSVTVFAEVDFVCICGK